MRELIFQEDAGQRLDKYLQKYLKQAPKSFLYRMLRKKNIVLNGKRADGSEKLKQGDVIRLYLADETVDKFRGEERIYPSWPGLEIVYEDSQVLLVNKPAGMLSQKAAPEDVSLNEYLVGYLLERKQVTKDSLAGFTPGVCNRLDRNTSGLVIGAKTLGAAQEMGRLLKERRAGKFYLALAAGNISRGERIRGWLVKDRKNNQVRISKEPSPDGVPIETVYEPLASNGRMTLLKVELITGKTHQIRSHLASAGHPLAGDGKYGDPALNRYMRERYGLNHQFLHSWQLTFPCMEAPFEALSQRTFTAGLSKNFQDILKAEGLDRS